MPLVFSENGTACTNTLQINDAHYIQGFFMGRANFGLGFLFLETFWLFIIGFIFLTLADGLVSIDYGH